MAHSNIPHIAFTGQSFTSQLTTPLAWDAMVDVLDLGGTRVDTGYRLTQQDYVNAWHMGGSSVLQEHAAPEGTGGTGNLPDDYRVWTQYPDAPAGAYCWNNAAPYIDAGIEKVIWLLGEGDAVGWKNRDGERQDLYDGYALMRGWTDGTDTFGAMIGRSLWGDRLGSEAVREVQLKLIYDGLFSRGAEIYDLTLIGNGNRHIADVSLPDHGRRQGEVALDTYDAPEVVSATRIATGIEVKIDGAVWTPGMTLANWALEYDDIWMDRGEGSTGLQEHKTNSDDWSVFARADGTVRLIGATMSGDMRLKYPYGELAVFERRGVPRDANGDPLQTDWIDVADGTATPTWEGAWSMLTGIHGGYAPSGVNIVWIGNAEYTVAPATIVGNEYGQKIIGMHGDNTLYGKGGIDTILAGMGNDKIDGGEGADILYGQLGNDAFIFRFETRHTDWGDTIKDWNGGDRIWWDHPTWAGPLAPNAFVNGTAPVDASTRFIYNQSTGEIWWDQDGTGSIAAIHMVTIEAKPALNADHFYIY